MRTYQGKLTTLPKDSIFVFGSNTQGRHGRGAALSAVSHFGAIYGQPIGPQGGSYAIVTKDLTKQNHPSIPMEYIMFQIKLLYEYAKAKGHIAFYVVYSGEGANLNGWSPQQMAAMFAASPIPENMVFEEKFAELIKSII